jgi:hypothetical protein
MTLSSPNAVARLAFAPLVRRAVQSLPQHFIPETDDRFNQLLERLSGAENGMERDVVPPGALVYQAHRV